MKNMLPILVIDDEPQVRNFLADFLRTEGWDVSEASSADEAFRMMNEKDWTLVFCDVRLGDTDGYAVLRRFTEEKPEAKFVLITGYESAAGALEATSTGAYDYLVKPFSIDDLSFLSNSVREQAETTRKNKSAKNIESDSHLLPGINLIGRSPKFIECMKMVGRVAPTGLPVLITGESGTGKEMVARAIHNRSSRAKENFVAVNCGAIPVELIESELFGHARGSFTGADRERVGLWEEAGRGTIFLDEITETAAQFQVKILRALQQSEIRRVGSNHTIRVDVRVIAATNRNIEDEAEKGNFREDLMYRLNAVTIDLPPLRERVEDVPLLAEYFAKTVKTENAKSVKFSPEAMKILKSYTWQGNVRELENAVLHAVSMSDGVIYPEHLPVRIRRAVGESPADADDFEFPNSASATASKSGEWLSLAEMQFRYVTRVLNHTDGNKQAAARILDIDRKTLSRMLKRSGN